MNKNKKNKNKILKTYKLTHIFLKLILYVSNVIWKRKWVKLGQKIFEGILFVFLKINKVFLDFNLTED